MNSLKHLPPFRKYAHDKIKKTIYVEVVYKDDTTDCAYFGIDEEGNVFCDTGYSLIDMNHLKGWRDLVIY